MTHAGVLVGALLLSLLHSLIPNHWGPFVLVGRLRRWTPVRLAVVTLVAGFLHSGVTMAIGLGVAYSMGCAAALERFHSLDSVAALILIVAGSALILGRLFGRHLHKHFEPDRWSGKTDALLVFTLIGMLAVSPCAEILPLYILAAANSWRLVVTLSAVVVIATTVGMTLTVLAVRNRLSEIRTSFIEENEGLLAGFLLVGLGAWAAWAHDGLLPGVQTLTVFGVNTLRSSWKIFADAAAYILFGCFMGGLVYAFIRPERVAKFLGRGRFKPVVTAALIGIPLPLCSCGVIPAALTIRRLGATRGATTAFLITTPETGLDSMAVTYALLDPIYTIFRPVAAFVTGVTAGIIEAVFGVKDPSTRAADEEHCPACHSAESPAELRVNMPLSTKLKQAVSYGLGDFLQDISPWLVIGFLAAGLILTVIPPQAIESAFGGGIKGMLLVLVLSIPLYICASATTPMAAALLLQGASPGAALVLLLAGPASNTAGIVMLTKFLGKRSVMIYLASIAVCSLGFGLLLNVLYAALGIDPRGSVSAHHAMETGGFKLACAVILAVLVAIHLVRTFIHSLHHHPEDAGGGARGLSGRTAEVEREAK